MVIPGCDIHTCSTEGCEDFWRDRADCHPWLIFVKDSYIRVLLSSVWLISSWPPVPFCWYLMPVSLLQSSMDEVIAATAYLELFIRRITEPAMMQTFLRFILTEKCDDISILQSLIMRINSTSRVGCLQSTFLSLWPGIIIRNPWS